MAAAAAPHGGAGPGVAREDGEGRVAAAVAPHGGTGAGAAALLPPDREKRDKSADMWAQLYF